MNTSNIKQMLSPEGRAADHIRSNGSFDGVNPSGDEPELPTVDEGWRQQCIQVGELFSYEFNGNG